MNESVHSCAPSVGTLVGGRYRLDRLAGSGGMAQVWAATDTVLGRRVAVKMLHPHLRSDESLVRRFRQEGRLSARLTDPGIVGIFDTVATPDADAIVMEFVEGSTLRQLLDEQGRLDAARAIDIGCRVADALDVAHRHQLIHRDIKPANILLCTDGTVKVADFGIAKTGDLDDLTRDGTVLGTATYLAPEQLRGEPADGRSDLYSLGVVLYEAVCGRPPFTGDTEAARAMERLTRVPLPPHRVATEVPLALSQCIMRALERDPQSRPHSAGEFRAALAVCLAPTAPQPRYPTPPSAIATQRTPNARKAPTPPRRSRLGVAVLVLLIGGALALIAALLQHDPSPRRTESAPSGSAGSANPVAVSPLPVPIRSVATFDPEGTGAPGENDRLLAAVLDGDPSTTWRTEGYQRRDFGTKSGVGLVIEADRTRRLQRLVIDSPSSGWVASARVISAMPKVAPAGDADPPVEATGPATTLPLHNRRGNLVLLWFSRLGTGGPPFRVDLSEIRLYGDP